MQTTFTLSLLKFVVSLGNFKIATCLHYLTYDYSRIFNDFGPMFEIMDATGEEPLTGMIAGISKVTLT